ncbi:CHASE3 domain-containing protein [Fulvivirgaceae bacterium PWU5]|uniref:CHASE3 domain-containing protein n=1 Tax=Dawidia cretensis TaxID=2782350 RepID=A0AAP2DY88_9BACT|nr:CHASE3 domain-containing protein [Dawidia cretensis]MBT1708393.1 CHASE3 domain-containing protein [Dawidia cretensis]
MAYLAKRHANYTRCFRSFLIGICIASVFTAGVLYVRHIQTRQISENVAQLSRSAKIANGSDRFQRNFRRMAGGLRNYLSTGNVTSRHIYEEAVADNNMVLHELGTVVPDGSEQKILLDDIRELQQYWIDEVASPLLKVREAIVDEQGERYFQELCRQKQVRKLEVDVGLSLQRKFSDLLLHTREAYLSGPAN